MNKIIVYCDGGCRNNQSTENIGSWAAILEYNGKQKELSGTAINTTNNKMELIACIKALEGLNGDDWEIDVYSDSQYLVSAFNDGWIINWIANGWRNAKKQPVENQDLWKALLELKARFKKINFFKSKGHSDDVMNNKVDTLVNVAMDNIKKDFPDIVVAIDKIKVLTTELASIANLSSEQSTKIYEYLKEKENG